MLDMDSVISLHANQGTEGLCVHGSEGTSWSGSSSLADSHWTVLGLCQTPAELQL